jgi:hypothetical protein
MKTLNNRLCEKIRSIYPSIGECNIDLDVEYDWPTKSWLVDLRKGEKRLQTRLETSEAQDCLAGKQCISLGNQISQLVSNIEKV